MAAPVNPFGGGSKTPPATPAPSAPAASGGGAVNPFAGKATSTSSAPAKKKEKKGGGLLRGLGQVKDLVANAGPGLVRFGIGMAKELAPSNPLHAKALPAKDRGWHAVEKQMPMTAMMGESVARTARQVPDTAVAVRPGGPGFGQSNLGHQIRDEGYLSTGLAKAADLSMLAGGAGLVGKSLGAGHLAEAARLEKLAAMTAKAAKVEATESALAKAAMATDAAGNAAKATDLAKAADQMAKATKLREAVASGSKAAKVAETVTAKATSGAHLLGKGAAAPFLPTEKALGLAGRGLGALARSEAVAPLVEKAGAAVERSQAKRAVGDVFHETVTAPYQAEMHTLFERHGLDKIARTLTPDEQAAVYLSKSAGVADPAVRNLLDRVAELPPEVRPDAVARILPGVTPEQVALARAFDEGTLDAKTHAKLHDAAEALTAVQERRESRNYVTGKGTSKDLSPEAIRAREQRAAGQSADMDVQGVVDRKTAATRGRLARIEDEAATLEQTPAEPKAPSAAQDRRLARHTEQTRRAELTVKGEEARGERTMSRASKIIEKNQTAAGNRQGQVMGRGRERMEQQSQLGKPSRGEMQARITRDSRLASEKSAAENGTANKILAEHAGEQRTAAAKAQEKLKAARSAEAAAKDKFERENQVRGERAQEKRLATLDRQHDAALTRLAKEEHAARTSIEAAPPQDRPALQVAHRAKELALELAESHPERASEFAALADDIATTSEALRAKGVKPEFFMGGKELDRMDAPPPTPKMRQAQKLQSEKQRVGGPLASNIKAQTEKMAKETLGILHNEFRGKVASDFGGTVAEYLDIDTRPSAGPATLRGLSPTGEKLAEQLAENHLVAWDPKTGKLLDAKDIDANSAVLPKTLHDTLTKYTATRSPNLALRIYDRATGTWKHTVLALSPRWHVGNIVGNAALASLGAGLTPSQIARNVGEARRLVKDFDDGKPIPAEHQAALERLLAAGYHNPDLGAVDEIGRFKLAKNRLAQKIEGDSEGLRSKVAHPISSSYHFNEYVDSVNRTMVYLAKHKTGISSEAAVQMALKAAGDFSKMTPFERNVVRRIIPFYAWQRHITRLAFSLPVEAPARVAWTLHLSQLPEQLSPDPGAGNEFNSGTIPAGKKRLNVRALFPFGSSFFTDPSFQGGGYQINPVAKLGIAAGTGLNVSKGLKPVQSKENKGGFGQGMKLLAGSPKTLAEFAAAQVPETTLARDLVAGKVPVRYDTGQPRKVGKGATKKHAKPTLTGRKRGETLARFAGIPIPEPETKATSKKK